MSLSYAESLSYFPHKGKVGMPELNEKPDDLKSKFEQLEQLIRESRHTVVITGAGISTDAGIPDFRGPNGVWTLEKRGEKPTFNTGFDKAIPTYTHRALCKLAENDRLHFVISQNIDGLHHRSGLSLDKLAELHGNVFAEECEMCRTQIIRPTCVGSYCRKRTGNVCNSLKGRKKSLACRGKLRDTVLDWEDPLPELALKLSEEHCAKADLCLCLGTSLQIRPCRDLPRKTKKSGGKIVIVNLQKTSLDSLAHLIIHERCDRVMKYILTQLNLDLEDNSSPRNTIDVSKYPHVNKVLLLTNSSNSGQDDLGNNLAENLEGLLLPINRSASDESEDRTLACQMMMMEKNDTLCSSHSIWIITNVQYPAEINFFKGIFTDRVLVIRMEDSEIDANTPCSFTFSKNEDANFNEQMTNLMKILRS